jgi:hypothetical protein
LSTGDAGKKNACTTTNELVDIRMPAREGWMRINLTKRGRALRETLNVVRNFEFLDSVCDIVVGDAEHTRVLKDQTHNA